ncbi:MAG: hypothetical protein J1F22_08165 [Lachnospiraceae bacterium]|nr:hypothetical protein [Lachnospiraceae bacterium]
MSITISAASGSLAVQGGKQTSSAKPTWNPNKVYKYLEDMNQGFQNYKQQAVSYYRSRISQQEGDGTMSVEDLKKEIEEWFPEYTLTDSEPSKVVTGKFYLYIDQSQLKKMASDPEYRAKVYGLMDSELQGKKGYTLQYSDGRNVTSHLTGSIFSLCEANRKFAGADGIPYRGSCTSDHPFSSSNSHAQVRSMSFLYDNIDPAKSAAKDRKAAAVKAAEKAAKKRSEQKQAAKKTAAKKASEKTAAKKAAARKAEKKELAQKQDALRAEKRDEAKEAAEELLEQQMEVGAGTFFDTTT